MDNLKEKVKEALKATNGDNAYYVGMRNAFRYVICLIDGKEPQYEKCLKGKSTMIDVNASIKKAEKEIGREMTEEVKQAVNAFGHFFNLITSKSTEEKDKD